MTTLAYSPWGGGTDAYPFNLLFDEVVDGTKTLTGVDALVLWGGTDIHPSLYKAQANRYYQGPAMPSERDVWEWNALKYCKANGIPVIGVCRGAQLMCAFAGGKLIQHVNGHHSPHGMVTNDGRVLTTTSCHHQMLDLDGVPHQLLAWTNNLSSIYYGEKCETPAHMVPYVSCGQFKEPEVVYFPEIKGIGIQGHPEWVSVKDEFVEYCLEVVQTYLFEENWV